MVSKLNTNITHVIYNYAGGIGILVKNICSFRSPYESNIVAYQKGGSDRKYNLLMILYLYIRLLYKLRYIFDIIYIHGLWGPHLWLPNKNPRQKIIISTHGELDRTSLKTNKYLKRIVWKIISKKYFSNADCIIAGTLKEISDIKFATGNIHPPIALIPYGIDFESKLVHDQSIKQRYLALAKGKKIFLSLSRLNKSKGIDMLIESFALLLKDTPDCILFIAGSGEHSYEQRLRKKVIDLQIGNNFCFHGHVSGEVKDTIYAVSDIFVLPSFNDGFGFTVLEAYRNKVPVICANAIPFYEIKQNNYGWYRRPNKEDLLSAMKEATKLTNEELRLS